MAEQQTEGQFEPRDRVQLQAQLRENLESLGGARIGDLTDDEVKKLQIRMDVLERWALLNDAATGDMYHDDDTKRCRAIPAPSSRTRWRARYRSVTRFTF